MSSKKHIHKPYNRFKGFLREKGLTYCDIADLLGVTPSTVSMKINGYSDFYLSEQRIIKFKYQINEDIFI